ncbi:MAG: hypothetical protein EPN49_11585 [Rhodanobacter sp.]|nr:MAG: hypothetical protein EPN49_11585 [Rhodanobacter sp.]
MNASVHSTTSVSIPFSHQIGISTTRLHAFGPRGAEAPTIERFVPRGDGQVRHAEPSIRR